MTALALPQPEYRALMLLDQIPDNCTTFLCTNASSLPHVRPGEVVIVDTSDRQPSSGELFVIRFGEHLRNHHICLVSLRKRISANAADDVKQWHVGAARNAEVRTRIDAIMAMNLPIIERNRLMLETQINAGGWSEGPYNDDPDSVSYQHLCHCLVGRVIGIYEPTFEGPTREQVRSQNH